MLVAGTAECYRQRVVKAIGEGLDDLREGRVTSDADLTKEFGRVAEAPSMARPI